MRLTSGERYSEEELRRNRKIDGDGDEKSREFGYFQECLWH